MKKRISLLVAIVMLAGLMPVAEIPALAADSISISVTSGVTGSGSLILTITGYDDYSGKDNLYYKSGGRLINGTVYPEDGDTLTSEQWSRLTKITGAVTTISEWPTGNMGNPVNIHVYEVNTSSGEPVQVKYWGSDYAPVPATAPTLSTGGLQGSVQFLISFWVFNYSNFYYKFSDGFETETDAKAAAAGGKSAGETLDPAEWDDLTKLTLDYPRPYTDFDPGKWVLMVVYEADPVSKEVIARFDLTAKAEPNFTNHDAYNTVMDATKVGKVHAANANPETVIDALNARFAEMRDNGLLGGHTVTVRRYNPDYVPNVNFGYPDFNPYGSDKWIEVYIVVNGQAMGTIGIGGMRFYFTATGPYTPGTTPTAPGEAVIVNSTTSGTAVINLSTEKVVDMNLPEGFTVKAYQATTYDKNGKEKVGKWTVFKSGKSFDDKLLQSLLNKGGIISITSGEIDTEKKIEGVANPGVGIPKAGAQVIKFAKIEPRPKLGKYAVNYGRLPELNEDRGAWIMDDVTVKTAPVIAGNLEYARPSSDPKIPGVFEIIDSEKGIAVKPLTSDGKQDKDIWFIREFAKVPAGDKGYIPASKFKKITVKGIGKAPALRSSGGKIKGKDGILYTIKGETSVIRELKKTDSLEELKTYFFWTAATAKKPASAKQELENKAAEGR